MRNFERLKLTQVQPLGWLRDQLEIQMNGLSGKLYDLWDSVGSYSGWLGGTGESWERAPYYLDGLLPLAYYTESRKHMEICRRFLDWTLNSQTPDGNFGPVATREDYWSRYCMLKVLVQDYEITENPEILNFARRYFRYVLEEFPKRPPINWSKARIPDLMYSMARVYRITGEEWIAEAALTVEGYSLDWVSFMELLPFPRPSGFYMDWDSIKDFNHSRLDEVVPFHYTHIVNVTMGLKQPSLRAFFGKELDDRRINREGILQLEHFHGTPSGCINGDEHLSGTDPRQGAELCSVVEYMFSLETMLEVTGDTFLADRLEQLAYNALPATITQDFMAHQYLQQANQVQVDIRKRPWYNNRDDASIFGLEPNFGCCTANMHQGWPKLVSSLWLTQGTDTLVSMVLAPSQIRASLGGGEICVKLETEYPFRETLRYRVLENTGTGVGLKIRIPGWCQRFHACYNGETRNWPVEDSLLLVTEALTAGDELEITLEMQTRYSHWHQDSVAVERGPLLYGLEIEERFKLLRDIAGLRDYSVFAETPWNYALCLDGPCELEKQPLGVIPFGRENPACALKMQARPVPSWTLENGNTSALPQPPADCGPIETVRLIPYGCTKLRISEFPWISGQTDTEN